MEEMKFKKDLTGLSAKIEAESIESMLKASGNFPQTLKQLHSKLNESLDLLKTC